MSNCRSRSISVILFLGLLVLSPPAFGKTLHISAEFSTIQSAIDESVDGDVVILADGYYRGEGNREIDFRGKAITVKSGNGPEKCIVDCEEKGRGFIFHDGEEGHSVLFGITIRRGLSKDGKGGGICCLGTSPTIAGCKLVENRGDRGAGMYVERGLPTIANCLIASNSADYGGAIYNLKASPLICGCTITLNEVRYGKGGAIYDNESSPSIINSILWKNGGSQICNYSACAPKVTYSIVEGGYYSPDRSNLALDPRFVDAGNGNFHLTYRSPAIDAGSGKSPGGIELLSMDMDGNFRPCRSRHDMGAYEYDVIYVKAGDNAETTGDGLSWASAYTGRNAIQTAIRNTSGGGIWAAAGNYAPDSPMSMKKRVTIYGGFDGSETDVAQRDVTKNITSIDGSGIRPLLQNSDLDGTAVLDGFVLTRGRGEDGGAMFNDRASPAIRNCVFSLNEAERGGSLCCRDQSSPIITNCVFDRNTSSASGGAIYLEGDSAPLLANCTFYENGRGSGAPQGSALYASAGTRALLVNCLFAGKDIATSADAVVSAEDSIEIRSCLFLDDALLADPEKGDFHLQDDSPCVNAGTSGPPKEVLPFAAFDFEGHERPDGSPSHIGGYFWDIGAFEVQAYQLLRSVTPAEGGGTLDLCDADSGRKFHNWLIYPETVGRMTARADTGHHVCRVAMDGEEIYDDGGMACLAAWSCDVEGAKNHLLEADFSSYPPKADTGGDLTAKEGEIVVLDGSKSYDRETSEVTYRWSQTLGPAVDISNPDTASPTFTAPMVGRSGDTLEFRLIVSDGTGRTDEDDCAVNILWVNDPPRDITLTSDGIMENEPAGTRIGTTCATDNDADDRHSYALVSGPGDGDNDAFAIEGNVLLSRKAFDYEAGRTRSIRMRATDAEGLFCEKTILVHIADAPNHEITATSTEHGTIRPSGTILVEEHGNAYFSMTSDGNCSLTEVTVDGRPAGVPGRYEFRDVTGDHAISAAFVRSGLDEITELPEEVDGMNILSADLPKEMGSETDVRAPGPDDILSRNYGEVSLGRIRAILSAKNIDDIPVKFTSMDIEVSPDMDGLTALPVSIRFEISSSDLLPEIFDAIESEAGRLGLSSSLLRHIGIWKILDDSVYSGDVDSVFDLRRLVSDNQLDPEDYFDIGRTERGDGYLIRLVYCLVDERNLSAPVQPLRRDKESALPGYFLIFDGHRDGHLKDPTGITQSPLPEALPDSSEYRGGCNYTTPHIAIALVLLPLLISRRR